jgi:hypothetical protein
MDGWAPFPDTFFTGIDAAINWGDGTAFFFKGSKYIKYVIADDTVDPDVYPREISEGWSDFPAAFKNGIDGAANWGDGTAYFFKNPKPGDGGVAQYLAYDIKGKKVRPGFPLPMTAPLKWPALVAAGFTGRFDDVLEWPQADVQSASLPPRVVQCVNGPPPTLIARGSFEMTAQFTDAVPSVPACCEYRQFIRGTLEMNGKPVKFILQDNNAPAPILLRPRPDAGSFDDNFREDGMPAHRPQNKFRVDLHYGHRDASIGNNNILDIYALFRRSGSQYIGKDLPGWEGPAGTFVKIDVDFRGQFIDTCNGGAVLLTKEWTVKCSVP